MYSNDTAFLSALNELYRKILERMNKKNPMKSLVTGGNKEAFHREHVVALLEARQ